MYKQDKSEDTADLMGGIGGNKMTLNDLKTQIISAFPEDAPPGNDTLYRLALLIDRRMFESYIEGARAYSDTKFDPPCLVREIYDEWNLKSQEKQS